MNGRRMAVDMRLSGRRGRGTDTQEGIRRAEGEQRGENGLIAYDILGPSSIYGIF